MGDGFADDLTELVALEFQAVGTEGIGVDDVASGVEVGLLEAADHLAVGEIPPLRVFAGAQALGLEQCAHTAVQIDDMVL